MDESSESLYGATNAQPEAPKPAAPGLWEQISGVFTEPTKLFQRLYATPSWGWALGAIIALSIVMTIVWGLKVDVDALLRPTMERNPSMDASQIDTAIEMTKKTIIPFGILGALVGTFAGMLIMGFFYWLIGKGTAEAEAPSYRHALTVASVPSLVALPYMLIISVMCFLRTVEGLKPEQLSPTSLGFFLHPENLKLHALLTSMDAFLIASYVMVFLAARHTMKLKAGGAWACALLAVVLSVGMKVLGAK